MTDFVFMDLNHRTRVLHEGSSRFVFMVVLGLYTGDYTRLDLKILDDKIQKVPPGFQVI